MSALSWGQDIVVEEEDWIASLFEVSESEGELADGALSKNLDTPFDLSAFDTLPVWDTDLNASWGAGWRDNALLAETSTVSSAFTEVEVDFFAIRPRRDGDVELLALLYSDFRYYEDVPGLDVESLSMVQTSADYRFGEHWTAGAVFEGLYSEQAFDASEQEFEPEAATVTVWRPEMGASIAYDFESLGTAELSLKRGGARYDREAENYDFVEGALEWSRKLGDRHKLDLGLVLVEENYDERLEQLSVGLIGEQRSLELDQVLWQAGWVWSFEGGVLERLSSRISYEQEDDALGDYYERDRLEIRQRLDMKYLGWDWELSLAYSQVDYAERRSAALVEERRSDEGWSWSVEGTRSLSERWDWLLRLDGAEKRSNASSLSYRSGTIFLGCQFRGLGGS